MQSPDRRMLGVVILAGALYLVVALATAALAAAAGSTSMRFFWRLSAFAISGVVFVAHLAYERFRVGSAARTTAWRAAVGVALGALALALAANIHDLGSPSGYRPRMLIALVAWPLLGAIPAFVAGLAIAALLGIRQRA